MKQITTVTPLVSNYEELVEQFGRFSPIGPNYKTAYQIFSDLVFANSYFDVNGVPNSDIPLGDGNNGHVGDDNSMTMITIECERENFDSAVCMFRYVGMTGERRVYEYTGTAK